MSISSIPAGAWLGASGKDFTTRNGKRVVDKPFHDGVGAIVAAIAPVNREHGGEED